LHQRFFPGIVDAFVIASNAAVSSTQEKL